MTSRSLFVRVTLFPLALVPLLAVAAHSSDVVLAPREYTTRLLELDADVPGSVAGAYDRGNAWVGLPGGRIARYDHAGRLSNYELTREGLQVRGLWAKGDAVIALCGRQFVRLTTEGKVTHLRDVDPEFRLAVPVRDGYVGLSGDGSLMYVADDGERRSLPLEEAVDTEERQAETEAELADGAPAEAAPPARRPADESESADESASLEESPAPAARPLDDGAVDRSTPELEDPSAVAALPAPAEKKEGAPKLEEPALTPPDGVASNRTSGVPAAADASSARSVPPVGAQVSSGAAPESQSEGDAGEEAQPREPPEELPRRRSSNVALDVIDANHVAYATADPYEIWIVGLDDPPRRVEVDESGAIAPEDAVAAKAPEYASPDVHLSEIRRVVAHGGRLAVERRYRMVAELAKDLHGLPAGSPVGRSFSLIDVIDPDTGSLVERIDGSGLKYPGVWAGYHGDSLVLLGLGCQGSREPYIAFASAR